LLGVVLAPVSGGIVLPVTCPSASDDRWWLSSFDPPEPAWLAGRYRIEALLGCGGGGDVHRAWDRLDERVVAIKRVRSIGPASRARVRREVHALRLLDLPGVVRILDEFEQDGTTCLVMELVEGRPFPGEGRRD